MVRRPERYRKCDYPPYLCRGRIKSDRALQASFGAEELFRIARPSAAIDQRFASPRVSAAIAVLLDTVFPAEQRWVAGGLAAVVLTSCSADRSGRRLRTDPKQPESVETFGNFIRKKYLESSPY
jgi:hypothetical protein